MRKGVTTAIFIILVAALVLLAVYQTTKKPRFEGTGVKSALEKMEALDYENKYPTSASDVVAGSNTIHEFLYSGITDKDKIVTAIQKLRILYAPELVEINPEQAQIDATTEQIANMNAVGFKIIGSKVFAPEYYDNDVLKCSVRSILYTNSEENEYYIFYLSKDKNGLWKIMGWETTEKFDEGGAIG